MNISLIGRLSASVVAALALTGCSPAGPERFAVHGKVTMDGQPVSEASIIFTPLGKGLAAAAVIENGQYKLSAVDGPSQGEFRVQINPGEIEIEQAESEELPRANKRPRIPLPYQQGKLTATITGEPEQVLDFLLTPDGR